MGRFGPLDPFGIWDSFATSLGEVGRPPPPPAPTDSTRTDPHSDADPESDAHPDKDSVADLDTDPEIDTDAADSEVRDHPGRTGAGWTNPWMWNQWGRTSMPSMGMGMGMGTPILGVLLDAARKRLVGRRRTAQLRSGPISFTITEIDVDPDKVQLSAGQADQITIRGDDIEYGDYRAESAEVTLRNVHLRVGESGLRPTHLVAAPVDLVGHVRAEEVTRLLGHRLPSLATALVGDVTEVRWSRRPDWAALELDATVDGTRIYLRPRAVVVRSRRIERVRRLPAVPVELRFLPESMRLTRVEVSETGLQVRARLDEWRYQLPSLG